MANEQTTPECISVFKSGESTTSKEAFTKMWIDLINKLERSKSSGFCMKNDDKPQ